VVKVTAGMVTSIHDELLKKYPKKVEKARRSPLAAIYLHCKECCNTLGRKEVVECPIGEACFLYRFRLGKLPKRNQEG